MSSFVRYVMEKMRWLTPVVALVMVGEACELDVADPSVIREEELQGPPSVPTTINGVIGDLAAASEHYVLYSGLFTDEFILAGTFPTRIPIDERNVRPQNSTIEGEVDENLQIAREQADKMVTNFEGFLGQEGFDQEALRDGIAIGQYVGGLIRMWLGELWCSPVIEPAGEPVPSDQVLQAALAKFEAAEAAATEAGLPEWADAARLGQARAHLWLGDHVRAATIAGAVPDGHRLFVEYSSNDPEQFNKVFDITWGSQNEVIRWTVGDGTDDTRGNERFREYDTFVDLGIIDPDPGSSFESFNGTTPVKLQLIYDEAPDDILVSSGAHARLIEAEALIRDQTEASTQLAEDMINGVRSTWAARWTRDRFRVETDLAPIELSGELETDLLTLASELARETWLNGTRQETLRRFVLEFGDDGPMDLYPDRNGDDECWPVTEQEEVGAVP